MENLILYMLKVSVSIMLFYGLHMLFLRNETFLRLRRIYFLFALVFSLVYPMVTLDWNFSESSQSPLRGYMLSEIEIFINGKGAEVSRGGSVVENQLSYVLIVFALMALGTFLLFARFVIQLSSLGYQLRKLRTNCVTRGNVTLIDSESVSSFSFFQWVVVNKQNCTPAQLEDVLCHEKAHAKQLHSIDVVFYELLCILLWWNPFAWALKKEMKLNLEYLADITVLQKGEDRQNYQYTLLQISIANTGVAFINNFNVTHLKQRIMMMNKKKTSMVWVGKYLTALPLAMALLLGNIACTPPRSDSKQDEASTENVERKQEVAVAVVPEVEATVAAVEQPKAGTEIFTIVENMPSFPGGEVEMMKYISQNLKYPKEAQDNGVQGRVTVRFVVSSAGDVTNAEIVRGVDPACDAEALRVIRSMPKWKPGMQNGKVVSVYYTLPILFRLK